MGIRNWFGRGRKPAAAESFPGAATAPIERKPLTPAQLADLREAWGELRESIEESGVKSIHACTRDGSLWEEDANSVRFLTSTLRDLPEAQQAPDRATLLERE